MAGPIEVNFSVDVKLLFKDPVEALYPVLRALRGWELATPDAIEAQQMCGAMTNIIFRCRLRTLNEWVLMRIFGGDDTLFARKDEIRIFAAVAHAGLGPTLLASFGNGRVEEFLLDQKVTLALMKTPKVCACIGAALACFHFTSLPRLPRSQTRNPKPSIWNRLRGWAKVVFSLCTDDEVASYQLQNIMAEIDELESIMMQRYAPWLGFCHNDLQDGNMLLHTATPWSLTEDKMRSAASREAAIAAESVAASEISDDDAQSLSGFSVSGVEGGSPRCLDTAQSGPFSQGDEDDCAKQEPALRNRLSVRLIDYEYAGYNPVAYDFANHWCEYAADYLSDTPHRMDYSLLPDKPMQCVLLRAYVNAVLALQQHMHPSDLTGTDGKTAASEVVSAELARTLKLKTSFNESTHPRIPPTPGSVGKPDESALSPAVTVSADSPEDSLPSICRKTKKLEGIVEELRVAALAYIPISHLHWGLWGIMLARTSKVPDFDFEAYGVQRLGEYRLGRAGLLSDT